jgi:hypothetical protein
LLGAVVLATAARADDEAEPTPTTRVSAVGTAGFRVVHETSGEPLADTLSVAPTLHGQADLEREAGSFLVRARASLLLTTPTPGFPSTTVAPTLSDLGSYVEGAARLGPDASLAVRVMPFSRRVFRVPFDFANGFDELRTVIAPQPFAPAVVVALSGSAWRASVGAGFNVIMRRGAQADASNGRVIASAGVTGFGFDVDLRGALLVEDDVSVSLAAEPTHFVALGVARVAWRTGRVGQPSDFFIYGAAPERFLEQFKPLPEPGLAFEVEGEAGVSSFTRSQASSSRELGAPVYGQLKLALMLERQRLFMSARVRSVSQVTWSQEAVRTLIPTALEPHVVAFAGVDRRLGPVLVGAAVRVSRPAVLRGSLDFGGSNPPPGVLPREIWYRGLDETFYFSRAGHVPALQVAFKGTVRVDLGPHLTLLGELDHELRAQPTFGFNGGDTQVSMVVNVTTAHVFAQVH